MRPLIKYGIPAAAGLAVGGMLAQDQQPGVAALGGLGAALGTAAGLKGARLAGRYSPQIVEFLQDKAVTPVANVVGNIGARVPAESKYRNQAVGALADAMAKAETAKLGEGAQRTVGKVATGLTVPVSAGLAALGGQAAGMIPGAIGVPGFTPQQQSLDPESYGSSNSPGARYKQTTGSAGITGYYQ